MDRQRTGAGLDVRKDSIYLCIMGHDEAIIFQKNVWQSFCVQCTVKRKTKMKVQVAIARKILVSVWHMLSNDEDFIDVYLKRLEKEAEEHRQTQESIQRMELCMVN